MQHEQLERPGDYIDGGFRTPTTPDAQLEIHSPADLDTVVAVHDTASTHVEAAVHAARAALPDWRSQPQAARARALRGYAERLRHHREALAQAIAMEVGKPLWEAQAEADAMAGKVELMLTEGAEWTRDRSIEGVGEIRFRPHGVLAILGPFNFPGHLPNGQLVPALLLGNCIVHKPSERTPSCAYWMARCAHEAGLPAGVFNVVQGAGQAGQLLSEHEGIDGVLFTGSAAVGKALLRRLSDRPGRIVALELGGKNASIVLDDAELERTARTLVFSAFATAGQRCTSTSRLIVTTAIAEPLLQRLLELTRGLRVGHPMDSAVFMGPVIAEASRTRIEQAGSLARRAGFQDLLPGGAMELRGRRGYYMAPAIRMAPGPDCHVEGYSDTELFGPDLAVYVVADAEQALALANRTRFGLSAAVFTRDRHHFEAVADELRVGVIHWNRATAGASGRLPFGGIGDSGNHRPAGILAGTSCAYPAALLSAPGSEALPSWPGMEARTTKSPDPSG